MGECTQDERALRLILGLRVLRTGAGDEVPPQKTPRQRFLLYGRALQATRYRGCVTDVSVAFALVLFDGTRSRDRHRLCFMGECTQDERALRLILGLRVLRTGAGDEVPPQKTPRQRFLLYGRALQATRYRGCVTDVSVAFALVLFDGTRSRDRHRLCFMGECTQDERALRLILGLRVLRTKGGGRSPPAKDPASVLSTLWTRVASNAVSRLCDGCFCRVRACAF